MHYEGLIVPLIPWLNFKGQYTSALSTLGRITLMGHKFFKRKLCQIHFNAHYYYHHHHPSSPPPNSSSSSSSSFFFSCGSLAHFLAMASPVDEGFKGVFYWIRLTLCQTANLEEQDFILGFTTLGTRSIWLLCWGLFGFGDHPVS
jgi:hypothetical protein